MALIDDLRRQAREEARLIDLLTADFAGELDGVLSGLNRQIRRLVRTLSSSDGRLIADRAALGRALALRVQLTAALEASGFIDLVDTAFELDDLAAATLRGNSVAAEAARLTPIDPNVVTALQDLRAAEMLRFGEQSTEAIWRSILDGVIGSRNADDLTDELAEIYEVTRRQARTLHDTAVSTYSRQVRQLGLPGEPDDRFVYLGPNDAKTRPFCAGLVGEVRTREQISELSNGQIPNSLLTGGGYNCRHVWQFIGDFDEADL